MAEPTGPASWRKSTFSGTGNCVEYMIDPPVVRVRNSHDAEGVELRFTFSEWAAFVSGVIAGEADLPSANRS